MNLRLTMAAIALLARPSAAQVPVPTPVAIPSGTLITTDRLPPFERPNGNLLRPGTLTYALTLTKADGATVTLGTRTVTVSEASLGSASLWLIEESRRGTAIESVDSAYVARADLAPQRWTSRIGQAQLGIVVSRDTMYGAVSSHRGRSSFVMALPPGALLSAGMAERLVELLPLGLGYRAGATLILIDGPVTRAIPAEIVVAREERLVWGGRTVDCWLVAIRGGAIEQRLWVTRSGARIIRTEQGVSEGLLSATLQ